MTDQIDEAARATRKYATTLHEAGLFRVVPWEQTGEETFVFESSDEGEAQAACDRLNLVAVLKSILAMDRPFSREFTRDLEALIGEAEAQ